MDGYALMPDGGSTPLSKDDELDYVMKTLNEAIEQGLQYEWMDYFLGGIINNKKDLKQAAFDAAIEWDF